MWWRNKKLINNVIINYLYRITLTKNFTFLDLFYGIRVIDFTI